MKVIYSCKGCEDRYPGCHDHCYKYIEEKALRDKEKKEAKLKKEYANYHADRYDGTMSRLALGKRAYAGYDNLGRK